MRFLVFTTNDAEYDKISTLLKAAGILYEKKVVRAEDGKAQGYMLYVVAEDFDAADELLSMPEHNMSFSILSDHKAYRDEVQEKQKRINDVRQKTLRHITRIIGLVGVLYLLYAWFMRG